MLERIKTNLIEKICITEWLNIHQKAYILKKLIKK